MRLNEIWAIRVRLQLGHRVRELALFNLAIDSKLRACAPLQLRIPDVCHGDRVAARAIVMQQKTRRPVQFEITSGTRKSIEDWMSMAGLHGKVVDTLKTENVIFATEIANKTSNLEPQLHIALADSRAKKGTSSFLDGM